MADLELTEILQTGILYLKNWLNENGYQSIEVSIWQSDSVDIKANSKNQNILIQLKAIMQPGENVKPNATDKFAMKELAERLKRIPYIAYITIDRDKNIVGEIIWERL